MSENDREKIKNFREWLNLVVSIIAALGVPLAILVLHDQKLQIERDMAVVYVTKMVHEADLGRIQHENDKQDTNVSNLQTKIDLLVVEQVHIADNIALLREKMTYLTKP